MKYKLLDNGKGIVVAREVSVCESDLVQIFFDGAPQGANVIFYNESKSVYYRDITDGYCEIKPSLICGVCKVRVAVLSSGMKDSEWDCESLQVCNVGGEKTKYLVFPSDRDIPSDFAELRLENEKIRHELKELRALYDALAQKFKELVDGYDYT